MKFPPQIIIEIINIHEIDQVYMSMNEVHENTSFWLDKIHICNSAHVMFSPLANRQYPNKVQETGEEYEIRTSGLVNGCDLYIRYQGFVLLLRHSRWPGAKRSR